MYFLKLLGTVLAVFCHSGSTQSKLNGQRICRRGTERPCYRINYFQDPQGRLSFHDARQACRMDGGELLSIETDNEQRLVERFIQQLQATDGDFWIGLRRSPHHRVTTTGCPSQYYWLDGSKARFRNWHWDEPSCGNEMCVVLYHQPTAPADEGGRFMFQWNDNNCDSSNNFVCKYSEETVPMFTVEWNSLSTVAPIISLRPKLPSVTVNDGKAKIGLSESSGESLRQTSTPSKSNGVQCPQRLVTSKDPMPTMTSPNFNQLIWRAWHQNQSRKSPSVSPRLTPCVTIMRTFQTKRP
uniref:C-type lectin domain-containing protein n=1 Tax=Esox lucius TaxID=8010 RepID=A0AAY5K156_ESOLU